MENSITCRGSRRCHFRHKIDLPDLKIDDGAVTVFLYVDGKTDGISKDLVELVRFVGNTNAGNACSPKLEELLGYIDDLKQNPEVKEAYMTFEEYVESERREVRYEMRGEIEKLHEELDAKDEEINVVISERDSMKEELDAKDEALNAKDKEINTAFGERDAAVNERDAAISERDSMKEELNAKDKEINAAFRERDAALHRVEELEKMLKTR